MKTPTELRKALENNFVLLDTNILIESSKNVQEFQDFYDFLGIECSAKSVLDPTVKFEFFRGARTYSQEKEYEAYLGSLFGPDYLELHMEKAIFDNAKDLAILYGRNKDTTIEYGDCFIAAQMQKYSKNLFLATMNHSDFPRYLFERVGIYTLDIQKRDKICAIGFYRFNEAAFKDLIARYRS